MTDDEPPTLKPVADTITTAIDRADASRANVVPIDAKRKGRRRRATEIDPDPGEFSVEKINRDYALILMGQKAVIVKENAGGPIDDRLRVLTIEAFRYWFGNKFTEVRDQRGAVKVVTWAQAWLSHPDQRKFSGLEFHPDRHNAPGSAGYFNLWRGFAFEPKAKPNGWKTFRDHLLHNICAGDETIFNWVFGFFASMIQRPRERIGVALVLQGRQGSGKTIVGQHFGALFPAHYFLVDSPRYVTSNFNTHMASCLLLQADEAFWAGDKVALGRMKGLITSPFQLIEAKGIDPIRLQNYVHLLITSNEDWAVPAGMDERRFAVLEIDPRCVGNNEYFREMEDELVNGGYAALLHDLFAFDLERIDLRTIPKTAALLHQKDRAFDPIPAWWLDRLMAGSLLRTLETWEPLVPCKMLFDDFIAAAERSGVGRKAQETTFGRELKRLVPGLVRRKAMTGTGRAWRYEFPSLRDCQAAFDQITGQPREWPSEDEDDGFLPHERAEAADF